MQIAAENQALISRNQRIDEMQTNIIRAVQESIRIDSSAGHPTETMPFGEGPAKALHILWGPGTLDGKGPLSLSKRKMAISAYLRFDFYNYQIFFL